MADVTITIPDKYLEALQWKASAEATTVKALLFNQLRAYVSDIKAEHDGTVEEFITAYRKASEDQRKTVRDILASRG